MINFVHDIFIFSNLRGEDVCGQRVEEALAYLIFVSFLFHMKTKLHWNYIFCGDGKDTSEYSFCRNSEFFIGEIINTAYIFTGFLLVLLNFLFIYLFFFYSSMAGCYFSIFDFLLLCCLWGAWLQYNTDAKQGEKTSFNLLLIPNQKA